MHYHLEKAILALSSAVCSSKCVGRSEVVFVCIKIYSLCLLPPPERKRVCALLCVEQQFVHSGQLPGPPQVKPFPTRQHSLPTKAFLLLPLLSSLCP